MEPIFGAWQSVGTLGGRRYICGYCGSDIDSNKGYFCAPGTGISASIYICHNCNRPTLFHGDEQVPGPRMGRTIEHLPQDIASLYKEVQDSTAAAAYTAAVMAARKMLMHVAVECGAEPGKNFTEYVDYLVDNHYTPPNSKMWVDKIRKLGNNANHKIVIMKAEDAMSIITFLEMLLRFKYEFPELAATPNV